MVHLKAKIEFWGGETSLKNSKKFPWKISRIDIQFVIS